MEIGPESNARIQIDDQEPIAIAHAVIERDVLQSRLRRVTGAGGDPVALPVGALVTLYQGPSVVFVGRVEEDQSVIDLLSAEADDGNDFEDI
ncbi:MAG: hypothetical protein V1912_02695 [bacterium]